MITKVAADPTRAFHIDNGRPAVTPGYVAATAIRQDTGRWVVSFYAAHDRDRMAAADVDTAETAERLARTVLTAAADYAANRSTAASRPSIIALVRRTIAESGHVLIGNPA